MNIENQVCTLQQARKLSELGIEQRRGIFEWCCFMPDPLGEKYFYAPVYIQEDLEKNLHEWVASAWTAAELGTLLPDLLETEFQYELVCIKEDDCWLCRYVRNNNLCDWHPKVMPIGSDTEAKARAAMLISLLEKKLATAEDCNNRLNE